MTQNRTPGIGDNYANTVAEAICKLHKRSGRVSIQELAQYMESVMKTYPYKSLLQDLAYEGFITIEGSGVDDLVIVDVSPRLESLIRNAAKVGPLPD